MKTSLHGFTLIELLVTIAIAAVLMAVAAPSFVAFTNRTQQKSIANLLLNDLRQARSEAISRNLRVLLCVRNTAGTNCDSSMGASSQWSNGWIVCFDANADGICDAATAASPNPIVVRSALNQNLSMSVIDSAAAAVSSVRFNANSSQGSGSVDINFTLIGNWSGSTARIVSVARTGNISMSY